MIELVFGESTAGALKYAKAMKQGDRLFGATAVTGGTKKEQREAKKAHSWSGMTMGGSSKDVEALILALDIGDISDMDTNMNARKKVINSLYSDFSGTSDEIWKTNQHALSRIKEARTTLEPIRMWICTSDPVEMCSMYFVCSLMVDALTPLSVVCIPKQIERDNSIICYRSTGEVAAEELGAFIDYEESISKGKRSTYAHIWSDLASENAALRAIINGIVVSVPENFYDFAIRANIPDGEFKIAQLIGKTLNQIPGVGDRWLFLRIQNMIQSGELIEVSAEKGDHLYSGILKRNSEMKI